MCCHTQHMALHFGDHSRFQAPPDRLHPHSIPLVGVFDKKIVEDRTYLMYYKVWSKLVLESILVWIFFSCWNNLLRMLVNAGGEFSGMQGKITKPPGMIGINASWPASCIEVNSGLVITHDKHMHGIIALSSQVNVAVQGWLEFHW